MLVGRSSELETLGCLLRDLADGRGGALFIEGEAGIGKTALLQRARPTEGDATVLEMTGIESESSLSFGGLKDLIWPVVEQRHSLPEPQRAALEGALTLGPPTLGDRLAVGVATLGVLEAASADRPVVALVDDVHWLDSASRECVAYVARRARGPIVFLLCGRDGYDYGDFTGIPNIRLGPLDPAAASELLCHASSDLAPQVHESVRAAAQGNPLALLELPSTLTAEQRAGTAPLDDPLPLGRDLGRVYDRRLREVSEAARTALLVAAASHTDEMSVVGRACQALGVSKGELEAAETKGLVWLADGRVGFAHPLVRGAVYYGAPAGRRRSAHRALAEVVAGEPRAWHLADAAVGADAHAAAALDEVAGVASGRRAYASAAEALERAARLSEDPGAAAGRLLGAGAAALSSGRVDYAAALAQEAAEKAPDPVTRAAAKHLQGALALWSGRVSEARSLLEHSAEQVEAVAPVMSALILADASFAHTAAGNCSQSLALAERAYALLGEADAGVRAPVLAMYSWSLVLRGEGRKAQPLMREAHQLAESIPPFSPAAQIVQIALNCRLPDGDFEGALADNLERVAQAREAGALFGLPTPLCIAAEASYRLGHWSGLKQLCDEAIAAAQETGQWGPATQSAMTRARLAAATGREAECRADAEVALDLADSSGVGSMRVYAHGVLGFLELSAGRVAPAIEALELTARLAAESDLEEPTVVPWAPDLLEAYVRAGLEESAQGVLATLARQSEQADTANAAALAERCRGLLARESFDDHFRRALAEDDRRPMPFERARTQLAWGMRLHRARRRADARVQLRAAADAFDGLGAIPWAALARAELRAAGGRRRRKLDADGMTAQEERIARAAASGATTRQIAADLFLSPKTVEFHLRNAYRKLGVKSRGELATALAKPPDSAPR